MTAATSTLPAQDVVIMGGGLAGLTLALQLKGRFPDLAVLVLERRKHPVPHATHKVGESSVEIGAHYFDTVLGLIAEGLTNTEIAERLVVSAATVKTHVNHIFAKAGVRDRAQAVVYAYSHGLAGG